MGKSAVCVMTGKKCLKKVTSPPDQQVFKVTGPTEKLPAGQQEFRTLISKFAYCNIKYGLNTIPIYFSVKYADLGFFQIFMHIFNRIPSNWSEMYQIMQKSIWNSSRYISETFLLTFDP